MSVVDFSLPVASTPYNTIPLGLSFIHSVCSAISSIRHPSTHITEPNISTQPHLIIINNMAPQLNEEEIDDLIYFARAGEKDDLTTTLTELAEREKVSVAEILASAKDEGKSTCLHMAAGNGHLGMCDETPLIQI